MVVICSVPRQDGAIPTGPRSSSAATFTLASARAAVCMRVRGSVSRAQRRRPRSSGQHSRPLRQDGRRDAVWACRLPAERWALLPVLLGACQLPLACGVGPHEWRRGTLQRCDDVVSRGGERLELQQRARVACWRRRRRLPVATLPTGIASAVIASTVASTVATTSFTAAATSAAVRATVIAAGLSTTRSATIGSAGSAAPVGSHCTSHLYGSLLWWLGGCLLQTPLRLPGSAPACLAGKTPDGGGGSSGFWRRGSSA